MAVKTQNRIESLSVLLDGSSDGKMLLKEAYEGVLENVQKGAVSVQLKNTDLSGDPLAGTVEAKRFANATAQNYGTARTGGKGDNVKGKFFSKMSQVHFRGFKRTPFLDGLE